MRQRGFTLLEILIVMVIVGIMAGFAVLQLGSDEGEFQRKEIKRIQALVGIAREQAILEGHEYALGFWQEGYAFYELDFETDQWVPVATDTSLRERQLPESTDYSLEIEGELIVLEDEPPEKPQVFIYSSGEMTAFSLRFPLDDDGIEALDLAFDLLGRTEQINDAGS